MNQDEVYAFRDRVMELLYYEPDTGRFFWRINRRGKARFGSEAGTIHHSGYREIRIDSKVYQAHRITFLIMTEQFPMQELDHINGIRSDNRFSNLREATRSENNRNRGIQKNNKSKYIGVCFDKIAKKYKSYIKVDGVRYHLGYFDSVEDAAVVRDLAAIRLHLQFARLNFTYTLTENNQIVRYSDF